MRQDSQNDSVCADAAGFDELDYSQGSADWQGDTWFEALIVSWHRRMLPSQELLYLPQDMPIGRLCVYTGSGLATSFHQALGVCWKRLYGITVDFEDALMAESVEDKSNWIFSQFDPEFFCKDVDILGTNMVARNDKPGSMRRAAALPYCRMLNGGFPCVNRTPFSSARAKSCALLSA